MPSRQQRRRRERQQEAGAYRPAFGAPEAAGAALIGAAVILVVAAAILLSDGNGNGGATPQPAATEPVLIVPEGPDEEAVAALARQSIEALPRGEWPALYEKFTRAFRERCPEEEFIQVGIRSAQEQGPNLSRIRYKGLEALEIQGDAATVVVAGDLQGESEFAIGQRMEREEGEWKLAPQPDTQGCQAFHRLRG
jgi:hypothetical protein